MLPIAATTGSPFIATGTVVIGFFCYLSRREPLGGWLRLFFWQVFLGSVVTIALFDPAFFHPTKWNSIGTYAIAAVLFFPTLIAKAAVCVISVLLVWKKSWVWVRYMRITLWFDAAWQAIGVLVYGLVYDQNVIFQCMTTIGPIIWLAYFYKSSRVIQVFRDKTWTSTTTIKDRDLSNPADARELLSRATKMEINGHHEAALAAYLHIANKFRGTELGKDAQISYDVLSARINGSNPKPA